MIALAFSGAAYTQDGKRRVNITIGQYPTDAETLAWTAYGVSLGDWANKNRIADTAGFFCLRISRGTNLRYPMVLAVILLVLTVGAGVAWDLMDLFTLLALSALSFGLTLLGGAIALRARP